MTASCIPPPACEPRRGYPTTTRRGPWDEAIALAAEWIRVRSDVEGLPPVLVSNTIESAACMGNVRERAQSAATHRSVRDTTPASLCMLV